MFTSPCSAACVLGVLVLTCFPTTCAGDATLGLRVALERKTYLAFESIPVKVTVHNESAEPIRIPAIGPDDFDSGALSFAIVSAQDGSRYGPYRAEDRLLNRGIVPGEPNEDDLPPTLLPAGSHTENTWDLLELAGPLPVGRYRLEVELETFDVFRDSVEFEIVPSRLRRARSVGSGLVVWESESAGESIFATMFARDTGRIHHSIRLSAPKRDWIAGAVVDDRVVLFAESDGTLVARYVELQRDRQTEQQLPLGGTSLVRDTLARGNQVYFLAARNGAVRLGEADVPGLRWVNTLAVSGATPSMRAAWRSNGFVLMVRDGAGGARVHVLRHGTSLEAVSGPLIPSTRQACPGFKPFMVTGCLLWTAFQREGRCVLQALDFTDSLGALAEIEVRSSEVLLDAREDRGAVRALLRDPEGILRIALPEGARETVVADNGGVARAVFATLLDDGTILAADRSGFSIFRSHALAQTSAGTDADKAASAGSK